MSQFWATEQQRKMFASGCLKALNEATSVLWEKQNTGRKKAKKSFRLSTFNQLQMQEQKWGLFKPITSNTRVLFLEG